MFPTVVFVGLAAQLFLGLSMAHSDPYTPRGKGNAVVTETVNIINSLGIFPNDHKFLCRVAWVESKYGEARGTYRPGYHGGIWQVKILRLYSRTPIKRPLIKRPPPIKRPVTKVPKILSV